MTDPIGDVEVLNVYVGQVAHELRTLADLAIAIAALRRHGCETQDHADELARWLDFTARRSA